MKKFTECINGNSDKHPLTAWLDKEIYDQSDGDWDQKMAAFHIDDETDQDIKISNRESIQVWAVCFSSITMLLLLVLLPLP